MEEFYQNLTPLECIMGLVIGLLLGCILGQWLFIQSKKEDKIHNDKTNEKEKYMTNDRTPVIDIYSQLNEIQKQKLFHLFLTDPAFDVEKELKITLNQGRDGLRSAILKALD